MKSPPGRASEPEAAAGRSGEARSRALSLIFLSAIGAALFFLGLGATSLWDNDESTYAEIAKEMAQSGRWLTLQFNHQAWFCHPPMYMWLTAVLFKGFGWRELTARFFPALFAALGIIVLFEFGLALWNIPAGFWAAVIFGTSLQYLVQGRMASMDSMLSTFLLLSFYAAWRGFEEKKEKWWLLFFASSAMATLAKGVFGLAYPLFIFGIFLFVRREARRWKEVPWGKGVLLYFLIAAPWFVYETLKYGDAFTHQVFYFYTYRRVVSPILSQAGPWYYYFPILLFGFLPWSGFLPGLMIHGWANRADRKVCFLGTWVVSTFIFFTLVSTKLPNYILFLYPPLALLLANFWKALSAAEKKWGVFLSLLLVLFLGGGLEVFAMQKLLPKEMGGYLVHLFPILGILALGCGASLFFLQTRNERWAFASLAISISLFWLVFNFGFGPILESYKPMKPLGERLRALRVMTPEPVVSYHVPGEASLVFYGDTPILNLSNPDEFLRLWDGEKLYCFMEENTLDALKGKMGNYRVLGHRRTLWLLANFKLSTGNRP